MKHRRDLLLIVVIGLTVAMPLAALGMYHVTLGRTAPTGVRDGLMSVQLATPEGEARITVALLEDWERSWPDAIAGWFGSPFEFSAGTISKLRVNGAYVSPSFFQVTGLEIGRGRAWQSGDPPAVVLGERIAARLFGSAETAVGSAVSMEGHSLTVTGVIREGVRFPVNQQAWVPLDLLTAQIPPNFLGQLPVQVITLPPTGEGGRAYIRERLESALQQRPDLLSVDQVSVGLTPVFEAYVGDAVGPLHLFLVIAWCLFGIGAATIAHARTLEESLRRHEFAVREALGAALGRRVLEIVRRGTSQGLVGGIIGGAVGLLLVEVYIASGGLFEAYWVKSGISRELLLLGVGLIVVVTVISAIAGVWHARGAGRRGLTEAGGTLTRERRRLHQALLFFEIAPVAGLLVLAFATSRAVLDSQKYWYGEDPDEIIAVDIGVSAEESRTREILAVLDQRVEALPGVEKAGFVSLLPMQRSPKLEVELQGSRGSASFRSKIRVGVATLDYLEVLGGPASTIVPRVAPMAVASSQVWSLREQLGVAPKVRVRNQDEISEWYAIEGAVPDLFLDWNLMEGSPVPRGAPGILLIRTDTPPSGYLVARTRGGSGVERAILDELSKVGPELTVGESATYAERFAGAIRNLSVVYGILWHLAILVLALSVLGVYAISLRQVSARTRELAIRAALGASAAAQFRVVLGGVVVLAIAGAAIGSLVGWRVSELLQGAFLGGRDQASVLVVALGVLFAVGTAVSGSLPPIVRLLRTPPSLALRQE